MNGSFQFLTLTKWWAIPLIWLPVVCWCLNTSMQRGHTVPEVALMVVAGICIWTLAEYMLHRYLFHIDTKGYW
jgi:dihydroceramide fatty acyl 2-hydroxylase